MRPNSTALMRATSWTIWLVVLMTVVTELSAPFKALLVQFASHHWIAKSIISVAAFVLLYFVFSRAQESDNASRGAWYVVGNVVLGGLAIFSFFLWHFLKV